jgi:hypothetical protein
MRILVEKKVGQGGRRGCGEEISYYGINGKEDCRKFYFFPIFSEEWVRR